jgi:hypothetical protein
MAEERALIARIEEALEKSPAAVARALLIIYDGQTEDEKASFTTFEENGRGFSGCDASLGTWLVETVIGEGREEGRPEGQLLRGGALGMARNLVRKYAKTQLLAAARRRQAEEEAADEARCALEDEMEADRYAGQPDVPHAA